MISHASLDDLSQFIRFNAQHLRQSFGMRGIRDHPTRFDATDVGSGHSGKMCQVLKPPVPSAAFYSNAAECCLSVYMFHNLVCEKSWKSLLRG